MASTTNYSWTTPDDTDLVKDGAAAIRTLGSAIDTTVFNNAGAAIAKALIDAEGDLIVGDAADAVQRLAIGTTGQVLTVDTGVDGKIKWASAGASFAGCAVRKTTNQSMTTNVITALTWDAEDFDTDAFHSTSTNTSRFTVPSGKAGKYQIGYSFSDIGGGAVAGALILNYIYKNGSQLTGYINLQVKDVIDYWVTSGSVIVDAAEGDYFEIFYKNSDEAPNIYGGYSWAYFYYLGA